MKKQKICIVSLHKTGTTSVSLMLQKLGCLVTGPDTNLYYDYLDDNFLNIDKYLKKYDAFQDDPWYEIFEYIDTKHYDMKFVFLNREEESWLKSIQGFYKTNNYNNRVRKYFYGHENTLEYPEIYLEKYRKHNKRVMKYFQNKTNFIVIDVKKDEDAIRLQEFLGFPIRFKKFPWINKTPKTVKEKRFKKLSVYIRGYFGLNVFVKRFLNKYLDEERYIALRSNIRYNRALFRKFKNNVLNKLLKNQSE